MKNSNEQAVIPYVTEDGGNSWQSRTEVQLTGLGSFTYHFISPKIGWIIPQKRNAIYMTEDGGINWKEINTYISLEDTEIDFVNTDMGWALLNIYNRGGYYERDNILLKTTDGGISWEYIDFNMALMD